MKVRSHLFQKIIHPYRSFFVALLLLCSGFLFLLSLLSYHPTDQSLFVFSSESPQVANWLGSFGANVAAVLIYLFGFSSFLLLIFIFFVGCLFLGSRTLLGELDRVISFMLLIPSVAMLASYYHWRLRGALCGGGLLGNQVLHAMVHSFDQAGALVLVWSLMLSATVIIAHHPLLAATRRAIVGWRYFECSRWIRCGLRQGSRLLIAMVVHPVRYIYSLYSGSRVASYGRSIIHFDYDLSDHELAELEQAAHVEFWKTRLTEAVTVSEQERSGSLKQANVTEVAAEKLRHVSVAVKPYKKPILTAVKMHRADQQEKLQQHEFERKAKLLEEKLAHFDIKGSVVSIKRGPVVTLFEYQPAISARISKITALEDDLALALQAMSIRIIAPIPGTAVVGFEVANSTRESVMLAELIMQEDRTSALALPLVLGKDTVGNRVIVDLAKMPHLLIAGSTGSGKSVALHSMIISLLCSRTPDELKIMLIDPKRLEFAAYADIAHLLFPIMTQAKAALNGLRYMVQEMERRYELMKQVGARNISDYRALAAVHSEYESLPYIVVIIDELADLMMVGGRDIEDLLTRITQMARAAGIHVLVATQRPSVDVITGVIKVNFPSRISFRVTSKVDSRTILDCNGAEKLLGRGDMLFLDAADSSLRRVHGAYISDQEIAAVVNQIKEQREVAFLELAEEQLAAAQRVDAAEDHLYREVLAYVRDVDEISISLLQRRFRIGFNRSARIIESLEAQGIVAPADGGKMRKVIRQ